MNTRQEIRFFPPKPGSGYLCKSYFSCRFEQQLQVQGSPRSPLRPGVPRSPLLVGRTQNSPRAITLTLQFVKWKITVSHRKRCMGQSPGEFQAQVFQLPLPSKAGAVPLFLVTTCDSTHRELPTGQCTQAQCPELCHTGMLGCPWACSPKGLTDTVTPIPPPSPITLLDYLE